MGGNTLSWYQKSASGNFGMDVHSPSGGGERQLRLGGETSLSDDLCVKGKVDNKGTVSTAMTHFFKQPNIKVFFTSTSCAFFCGFRNRFRSSFAYPQSHNPNSLQATVSTEFDIFADDIAPKKIGFAFAFGDY